MEYAKKMAVVDPQVLEIGAAQPKGTVGKVLQRLDDDVQAITQYIYNQILDRYNDIDEKRVQEPMRVTVVNDGNDEVRVDKESESTPSGSVEVEIVDSVPKTLKRKAQRLVKKLKAVSAVDWNDRGVFVHNREVVTGSNMDLVSDVLRKRKHIVPVGWKRFANHLKRLNVSMDLIGNPERWHYIQSGSPTRPPAKRSRQRSPSLLQRWEPY